MRRITMWLLSTVAALVLLFSYRTSTNSLQAATVASTPATGSAGSSGSSDAGSTDTSDAGSAGSSSSSDSSGSSGGKTYTGSVAQTRWGPVQVSITVSGGKVTEVTVPVYPTDNHRDQEINEYALPILRQEALAAQSADIDAVSGATVTSDGYKQSLQAALDAAHLS
ncbi:FMN-binding protein [Actinoplanes sp. NPDC049548]|uniref:FMN-binding protein n=1 Tax=Actinoplanes sp. NPDC049548 TaxID=3155152 RepID=UPI00341ED3AE